MNIAAVKITGPLILAPLAGYSDLAFRRLCREYGAGLCYSEMVSAHGLVYEHGNTIKLLATVSEERPVAIQLFGAEPDIMAEAAAIVSSLPIDLIDINMGCPVRKVVKKGAGAALMKVPALARRIISGVVRRALVPVTVKIRAGWDAHHVVAEDFSRMAEDAGAQAVAVHARTWSQGFSGAPDWDIIRRVKAAINIPVFGNGSVLSFQDAMRMMAETSCDGVMIGRAALGNPWVFQPEGTPEGLQMRIVALQRHLDLIRLHGQPDKALGMVKNHASKYFKGLPGSAALRSAVFATTSFLELLQLVENLKAH